MKRDLADGVYLDLAREEYDGLRGRVNWSKLKVLARSPAHYRHALFEDRHDTEAMRLGRCAHMAVLEPEVFPKACAVWSGGRRAGKKWEQFRALAEHDGQEILKTEEVTFCLALQAAVRADPHAARYLTKGHAEPSVLSTIDGRACKSRFDFISTSEPAIVDLKTTRDASPEGFAREVWRMRYDAQAAIYQDAYAAATGGQTLPVVLIAVEKEPPHLVQVYVVPEAVLDMGRYHYRGLLEALEECERTGVWGGYVDGVAELSLPKWASDFNDSEDLTGMDLVFAEGA